MQHIQTELLVYITIQRVVGSAVHDVQGHHSCCRVGWKAKENI